MGEGVTDGGCVVAIGVADGGCVIVGEGVTDGVVTVGVDVSIVPVAGVPGLGGPI